MAIVGVFIFVLIAVMAFWMLLFLAGFIPYWVGVYFKERNLDPKTGESNT